MLRYSGPVRTSRIATDRSPERRTSRDESFPLPVAPDPSRHSPVLSHNGKGPLPPIWLAEHQATRSSPIGCQRAVCPGHPNQAYAERSEEHTSELQALMRISYAVFCLKKKN